MLRVGRAVLRQRPRQRRALLLEVVLRFLVIEFDQDVAGVHPIAKVVQDAADDPVGLRRDGDFVHGGQGADHFNRTDHGLLADGFDLDGLGRVVATASLGAVDLGATGGCEPHQKKDGRRRWLTRVTHKQ
jgi:hypothetical protein